MGEELIDGSSRSSRSTPSTGGRRAGGLRQADRLPRAPGPPLRRAVGAPPHARLAAVEQVGAWLGRPRARIRAGDDRARRLPPRQRPSSPRRRPPGSSRCSTGRWRRSATRSPTSATSPPVGARDDPSLGMFELSPVTREEGFLSRAELVARYEERSGRADDGPALVPDARALEGGDLHGGQLPARRHGRDRRPVPQGLRESVVELAERAREIALAA